MDTESLYTRLDVTRREVRLLHLLAGSCDEPLRCELHVVSLEDQPIYQGLSYTWGDLAFLEIVQLNNRPFQITKNLKAALFRLRRRSHTRILWIDAICINQSDVQERSEQVSLMAAIYSGASEALIWLGDSISVNNSSQEHFCSVLEDGKDMKWLKEHKEQVFTCCEFSSSEMETLAAFGVLQVLATDEHWTDKSLFAADSSGQLQISSDYSRAWKATLKLLELSWWSRIWVVQELVLAGNATLIVGSVSCSWEAVSGFGQSYMQHLLPGACCHYSAAWKIASDVWADISLMRVNIGSFSLTETAKSPAEHRSPHTAFLKVLWQLRHKEATDPRDKVYAILGLLDGQHDPFIKPDYSMSVSETFSRCMLALIQSDRSLSALIGPRMRRPNLPSWVIDLLPHNEVGAVIYFQNIFKRVFSSAIFNACGTKALHSSIDSSTLIVSGRHVDTVSQTATAWKEGLVAQAYENWETLCFANSEHEYPKGGSRSSAFWRTMIRDTIRDYHDGEKIRRANTNDGVTYKHFRNWILQKQDPEGKAAMETPDFGNFRKSFFIATMYQHFFTTLKAYIGLGDQPQPNDEIWVLFGGCVPFVLRPYSADSDHAGSYFLVGDCYVHGIMDGEAMDGWQENDVREVVLV